MAGGNSVVAETGGPPTGPAAGPTEPRQGKYDRSIFGGRSSKAAGASGVTDVAGTPTDAARAGARKRLSLQGKFLLFSVLVLIIIGGAAFIYLRPVESVYVLDS